jgi:hypothetical protein
LPPGIRLRLPRRQVSALTLRVPPPAKTRMRPKAAHEHACFAGCTNIGVCDFICGNCKISFGQDLQDYQDYEISKTLAHCKNLVNPVNPV